MSDPIRVCVSCESLVLIEPRRNRPDLPAAYSETADARGRTIYYCRPCHDRIEALYRETG